MRATGLRIFGSAVLALLVSEAGALVGGAPLDQGITGKTVVTIVGSRGNFCSGSLIAPNIVLTAAHCIRADATYKIIVPGISPIRMVDVRRAMTHPKFDARSFAAHRATADVALLQTSELLDRDRSVAITATPSKSVQPGDRFSVVGIGVTVLGEGKSGGAVRRSDLIATGKPGNLQIRLVDPASQNTTAGQGACTGDSGAPVFENQSGSFAIVGVVNWSTAPRNAAGCGGLTGVTPLLLYRDWIKETLRNWR